MKTLRIGKRPEARNLVWLFHASQELKKAERRTVGKIAVLGMHYLCRNVTAKRPTRPSPLKEARA